MIGRKFLFAATITVVVGFIGTTFGQAPADRGPDRHIVVLKAGASAATVAGLHGVVPDHLYEHALSGFAGVLPPGILARLQSDPNVAWIEPDQVYVAVAKPAPPSPPPQPAQVIPAGISRIGADLNAKADINGIDDKRVEVDVAIIDTGIELSHPDLNVFQNVSFVRRVRTGNDDNGHGTHVAGTVAALDNSIGVVGVAPGARLWAVKVLDRTGSGWLSDVIKGVDYVTANATAIEVANMSLGGGNSSALNTAIANSVAAGVVYVVAAGNNTADASAYSPANSPVVLAVSAIDGVNNTFAGFSNYGPLVDIAAPGINVLSTYIGKGYAWGSGTSMASPHVAGAVALYLADGSKPGNEDDVAAVRDAIIFSAFPQSGPDGFTGDPDAYHEPVVDASSL